MTCWASTLAATTSSGTHVGAVQLRYITRGVISTLGTDHHCDSGRFNHARVVRANRLLFDYGTRVTL
ncbi:MAG: hypothetical protein CM1200mP20_06720 [Pseudomonadota bacterium]|nr:MAG: hypothetical protein CM1200mP20_06720 [Pseudomonadota bacterium]